MNVDIGPMTGIIGMGSLPNDRQRGGTTTKRPLASCREELEQSWPSSLQWCHHHQQYLSLVSDNRGSIVDDEEMAVATPPRQGRSKRRRIGWVASSSISSGDDDAPATTTADRDGASSSSVAVREIRISPENRPSPSSSILIKAGWYTGQLSPITGLRHGMGATLHDDGTEYVGPYRHDAMDGYGTYKFVTARHLVPQQQPSPPPPAGTTPTVHHHSIRLHRIIETSYQGQFAKNVPSGKGCIITKTIDLKPLVGGGCSGDSWVSSNYDVPSTIQRVEVIHDVGMYDSNGVAVGEGVRVVYTSSGYCGGGGGSGSSSSFGGDATIGASGGPRGSSGSSSSMLQRECFRLFNGKVAMKVAFDYASWVCGCMEMQVPVPP